MTDVVGDEVYESSSQKFKLVASLYTDDSIGIGHLSSGINFQEYKHGTKMKSEKLRKTISCPSMILATLG